MYTAANNYSNSYLQILNQQSFLTYAIENFRKFSKIKKRLTWTNVIRLKISITKWRFYAFLASLTMSLFCAERSESGKSIFCTHWRVNLKLLRLFDKFYTAFFQQDILLKYRNEYSAFGLNWIGRGAAQFRRLVTDRQRNEAILETHEGTRDLLIAVVVRKRGRRHNRLQHAGLALQLAFAAAQLVFALSNF